MSLEVYIFIILQSFANFKPNTQDSSINYFWDEELRLFYTTQTPEEGRTVQRLKKKQTENAMYVVTCNKKENIISLTPASK